MIISWVGGALASKNKAQSLDHFSDKPPLPTSFIIVRNFEITFIQTKKRGRGNKYVYFCEFIRHCSHIHPYRIISNFYIIGPRQVC